MTVCPRCGGVPLKAIYYGLPVRLCSDEGCSTIWACCLWDWLIPYFPFNGAMMVYEGSYLGALWHWIGGGSKEAGA